MKVVVGITGASGTVYALSLIKCLEARNCEIHGVLSDAGESVLRHECAMERSDVSNFVIWHDSDDLFSSIASGSFKYDAMVILPCSMNTLAEIAYGLSSNLLTRAASVCLKEKRKLIIVPREMPLSIIHLENMLSCAKSGATIIPACPGFYHNPQTIADLIAHVTGKVMDLLDIDNSLYRRWGDAK